MEAAGAGAYNGGLSAPEFPMQLSDTRAIVTGGVSGLGLAVARHLVAAGGKVALFDLNDDKGAAAVAELGAGNARYFRTDVSDEAGVSANVAAAFSSPANQSSRVSAAPGPVVTHASP